MNFHLVQLVLIQLIKKILKVCSFKKQVRKWLSSSLGSPSTKKLRELCDPKTPEGKQVSCIVIRETEDWKKVVAINHIAKESGRHLTVCMMLSSLSYNIKVGSIIFIKVIREQVLMKFCQNPISWLSNNFSNGFFKNFCGNASIIRADD